MRERGLKSHPDYLSETAKESLPVRERGLKFVMYVIAATIKGRSPCGSVD